MFFSHGYFLSDPLIVQCITFGQSDYFLAKEAIRYLTARSGDARDLCCLQVVGDTP